MSTPKIKKTPDTHSTFSGVVIWDYLGASDIIEPEHSSLTSVPFYYYSIPQLQGMSTPLEKPNRINDLGGL